MSLTRFPAHGIMSLRHWLNHWLNDIMPCAGKCVNDNMPCARKARPVRATRSPLSTEGRPMRDQNLARSLSSLQDPPPPPVVSVETFWRPLGDQTFNFQQISWRSTETAEWPLSIRWETDSTHASLQRPMRVHWVLTLWETNWDLWETSYDQRRSLKMTKSSPKLLRFLKDSWEIIERLMRPLSASWEIAERSLKVRFPQRPLRDCFEPVHLMETTGTIKFTERSLENHGRPWRSLSAHWKTVERSVKLCSLSIVSQRFRLCGKGV